MHQCLFVGLRDDILRLSPSTSLGCYFSTSCRFRLVAVCWLHAIDFVAFVLRPYWQRGVSHRVSFAFLCWRRTISPCVSSRMPSSLRCVLLRSCCGCSAFRQMFSAVSSAFDQILFRRGRKHTLKLNATKDNDGPLARHNMGTLCAPSVANVRQSTMIFYFSSSITSGEVRLASTSLKGPSSIHCSELAASSQD